jgi:hypothetical protein
MHPPVAPNRTAVWLVRRSVAGPAFHVLRRSGQTVGRSPLCEVRIEHPSVSQRHAEIHFSRGLWVVRDLASKNGRIVRNPRRSLVYGTTLEAYLAAADALRTPCFQDHRGRSVSLVRAEPSQVQRYHDRPRPAASIGHEAAFARGG